MTRTVKNTALALSLALSTAIAAPAMAGGTISFSVDAQNAECCGARRSPPSPSRAACVV